MTNKLAIWLGLILIATITIDLVFFGPVHIVFLGKRLFELLEWIAFWR